MEGGGGEKEREDVADVMVPLLVHMDTVVNTYFWLGPRPSKEVGERDWEDVVL